MKYFNKILGAILVLVVVYIGYGLVQLNNEIAKVYKAPDKYAHTYSAEQADLIVVDFNKYGCEHCRSLHPILLEAIKRDGKIRYIPRTVTYGRILEETISAAVYAAGEQGKFFEMHNLVYDKWPIKNRKALLKHAKAIDLDIKKLEIDMTNPDIIGKVRENEKYFRALGLRSTPTLLIGELSIYSPKDKMPTVDELLEKFTNERRFHIKQAQ